MPLINIKGTNTAMVVRDELSIGVIISVVPTAHERFREYPPFTILRNIFRYNNGAVYHHTYCQNQARK